MQNKISGWIFSVLLMLVVISGCNNKHPANTIQLVPTPAEMNANVSKNVGDVMDYALANNGKINDSIKLLMPGFVKAFYNQNENHNIWSNNEQWEPIADSLYEFIAASQVYGLYPSDYHYRELQNLKNKVALDSTARKDANTWTKADLMLTDAFMAISMHLKDGRLRPDTIALRADTLLTDSFYIRNLTKALHEKKVVPVFTSFEPTHRGYLELKAALPSLLDSMDKKIYTTIKFPNKDPQSLANAVNLRLSEGGFLDSSSKTADSLSLALGIKKYQQSKRLKRDGKISIGLVNSLNTSDTERFKRIAITLDRYKQLPNKLPNKYIWVNIPSFFMEVRENDSLVMRSKIIVGKPTTHTPSLTSAVSDMVTYPQWTIPNSIIKKDILPALKKDPGYLARKGFSLVDFHGETIDPYSVNWEKYTKEIPYKVVQGSGDDNALGVLKFNFSNPYHVYLHDTNQRNLFKNSSRALSHGCVRVQDWQKLAFYISRNDSLNQKPGSVLNYNTDSIKNWLAQKVKKRIIIQNRIPVFIRYFTCEPISGKIIFYDDVYGEDKILGDKYFAGRNIVI